jgi:hypothetical protein
VQEVWQPIQGYEGLYEVSDQGRVRSLRSGKLMKLSVANTGYMQLNLSGAPTRRIRHVHRLVLEAFVGPCPPGMEGCHANGIRSDNRLNNLRWDTRKGNMADAIAHGRTNRGERCHASKLTAEDVHAIRGSLLKNTELAKAYGVARETIRDVRSGKRWGWLSTSIPPSGDQVEYLCERTEALQALC